LPRGAPPAAPQPHPPGTKAEDEEDWDLEEEEVEGAREEEAEEEESVTVLFDVRVAKSEGSALVFECATDGVSVDILHVTLDDGARRSAGGGPVRR